MKLKSISCVDCTRYVQKSLFVGICNLLKDLEADYGEEPSVVGKHYSCDFFKELQHET